MGQDFRRSLNIDGAFGICRMRKKRMSLVHKSNSIKNGMTVWTIIDTCRCMERAMGLNLIGTRTILSVMKQIYIKHQSKMHQKTSICEFHLSVNNQLDAFLSISNEKKNYSSFSTGIRLDLSRSLSSVCVCLFSCFLFKSIYDCNVCVNGWMAAQYQWLYSDLFNCRSLEIAVHSCRQTQRQRRNERNSVNSKECWLKWKKNRNENETAYSAIVIVIP